LLEERDIEIKICITSEGMFLSFGSKSNLDDAAPFAALKRVAKMNEHFILARGALKMWPERRIGNNLRGLI
jgi:hypothetical protein